ncbi:MAG: TIM barrel protein [Candidatus Verstraetearchaeota archaeon]|jgi:deoxyribonuclease-4|nr:TIM barrel protein [Candidatus Verstraetearchaeota archaeon]
MADRPRFGPAGIPPSFKEMKASLFDIPRLLKEENLDAFEYQAVRWGMKPQIKQKDAELFGLKSKENDILLSLHASYFINLCGDKETIIASKKRLIACALASKWMNAQPVVFHVGYYGERNPKEAFEICLNVLKEVIEEMKSLDINVKLGPETMGKISQFGSLDEIISLCENLDNIQPVIDWAHLHARDRGRFKTIDDYRKVLIEIENRLGSNELKNLHCHFTKIEFTDKGEKCHHTLDEKDYGPDFEMLAEVIKEFNLSPVIISESPILDVDAIKMKEILMRKFKN